MLGLAKEITASPSPRELDVIASTGEQVTIGLLAMAMHEEGLKAKSYTGASPRSDRQLFHPKRASCRLTTKESARISLTETWSSLPDFRVLMTKAISPPSVAAAPTPQPLRWQQPCRPMNARSYTDVDGVYTTDPRVVPEAKARHHHLRRNAGNGQPWIRGFANPLRRDFAANTKSNCVCFPASRTKAKAH